MYINRIKISLPLTKVNSFSKEWVPAYGYPFEVKNIRFYDGKQYLKGELIHNAIPMNIFKAGVNGERQFRFRLTSKSQKLNLNCTCKTSAPSGETYTSPQYAISIGNGDTTNTDSNTTTYKFSAYNDTTHTITSYGIGFVEITFDQPIDLQGIRLNMGPKFNNDTSETDRDFIYRIESFINEVRRSCNDITTITTDMNIANAVYVPFKDTYTVVNRDGKIYYLKPNESTDGEGIELLKNWEIEKICDTDLNGLVWGNNEFITVGNSGTIFASKDGMNWIDRRFIDEKNYWHLSDIAWNDVDKIYGMVVGYLSPRYIYTSKDGIVWNTLTTYSRSPSSGTTYYALLNAYRCKFIGNYFYPLGPIYEGTVQSSYDVSANTSTYYRKQLDSVSVYNTSSKYIYNIVENPSTGVMIGTYTNNGFYISSNKSPNYFSASSSGKFITSLNGGRQDIIDGFTFGNNKFVAMSYPATANLPYPTNLQANSFVYISSNDGASWTCKPTNINGRIYELTYIDNKFYGVGAKGLVVTSTDGENWTIKRLPTEANLKRIVKHDKTWVIIGDNGFVARYIDSTTEENS